MTIRHPGKISRVLPLVVALAAVSPAAWADSVGELRDLVGKNDNTAAWAMAQRMEPENAGDPEFDFWYGLAAKSAGQRNQAQFALERAVEAQPDNPRAKLELADIYYQFGNNAEAKRLFEDVLASNPPESVQQKIRSYLGAMTAAEERKETQVTYVVGVAAGHDSNVGSATDVAAHDTFFGPSSLLLNPASMAADAAFLDVSAGIDIVAPVNQRTLRFLSLSAQRHDTEDFFSGGNFDNTQFGMTGGWMLRRGIATWRIPVSLQALWAESATAPGVTANDDRFMATVGVEYTKPTSARTASTWYGRLGTSHYPSAADRDAHLVSVGANFMWSADGAPVTVTTSGSITFEPQVEDTPVAKNNEKEVTFAARIGLRWAFADKQSLTLSGGAQGVHYRQAPAIYPAGSSDRLDHLQDVALGWTYQIDRGWTLNADASQITNDSQRSLYDFDRTQFKVGSTWRF